MEKIYEVIKIKQVVKEIQNELIEVIGSPLAASRIAHYFIGDDDREVFLVLCLNTNQNVIAVHRCHIGSLDGTLISPREVFKACILNNARKVIVAHNHPSTKLNPSPEDLEITQILLKAGKILDIPLQDHIIINAIGDYFSFREEGFISRRRLINKNDAKLNLILHK